MSELHLEKTHPDWREVLLDQMSGLESGRYQVITVSLFHPADSDGSLADEIMAEHLVGSKNDVLGTIADYLGRKNDSVARIRVRYNSGDVNARFRVIFCRLCAPTQTPVEGSSDAAIS